MMIKIVEYSSYVIYVVGNSSYKSSFCLLKLLTENNVMIFVSHILKYCEYLEQWKYLYDTQKHGNNIEKLLLLNPIKLQNNVYYSDMGDI